MKLLSLLLLVAAALGCAATAADLADGIRAVVSDSVITDRQVKISASQAVELLRRQAIDNLLTPELFERKVAETVENATQALVDRQLIVHDFETAGYKLPETLLEDEIQKRIKEQYGDRMTMIKTLQAEGRTEEKLRQQIREQIMIAALQQKNISSAVFISPLKIENYYQQHQDQYKMEQVKVRVIELSSSAAATPEGRKQLAEDILTKLKEGADFAQMAQVYSTSASRKENGLLTADGWIDRSGLRKELADVAFSLAPKQLSPVVVTPDACYLMLVEDKRAGRPLSEVRDEIEKNLLVEERSRLQQKYIKKLRDKTFFRFF